MSTRLKRQLVGLMIAGVLGMTLGAASAQGAITVVGTNFGFEIPVGPQGLTVDAAGNLLVYGGFELVNGELCPNVARLRPDGSLDTDWMPMPDSFVAKALTGTDGIYLAGQFEHIAGTPHHFFAKVDPVTGALMTEFNPAPSEPVGDLILHGTTLYAGGSFTNIGGQDRSFIARLDAATGAAAPGFTNGPTSGFAQIYTLALDETGLYPGGLIYDIGGEARAGLAKVSLDTGDAIPGVFTNGVDPFGMISQLRIYNDHVYACGYFEEIGGAERLTFARLHRNTGEADTNFTCGITNDVDGYAIDCAVTPEGVFVGGDFTNYAGARDYMAKVSLASGALVPGFNAQLNDVVTGLAVLTNGKIAVSGWFTSVNGQPAGNITVLDPVTGAGDPGFYARISDNGHVAAAVQAPDGGWIAGGDFKQVHGVDMPYLARFNADGTLNT
ncbi:MAG: delta-60 repeat domain-containing protein, partial [Lentisphaerae bacterium]|nr:delta-60 repeat domain-containing protein [Lentisphaerota bacterium]